MISTGTGIREYEEHSTTLRFTNRGPVLIDKRHLDRVSLANQLPINRVAALFLPDKRAMETEIAVLTLMRWALESGEIEVTPTAPNHPDEDTVMWQIDRMADWEPSRAIQFLVNPENLDGEEVFNAGELAAQLTSLDAAWFLFDHLYGAMVATAP